MNLEQNKRFKEEILRALREGPKTTPQLYKIIKQRCPKYCNDNEKCTHKFIGTRQPEWKHRFRSIQSVMQKEFLIYLDKGTGAWKLAD